MVKTTEKMTFKKLLFRATKGTALTYFFDLNIDSNDAKLAKLNLD